MNKTIVTIVAATLTLVGCGGTEPVAEPEPAAVTETTPTPVETTATEPEPTPEPEPEPTAMSIEEAADRYLEIVAATNAAAMEAEALLAAERYREACEAMIEPATTALDLFAAEQWPGDVDRLVKDQLIPLEEDEIDAYTACASASSDRRAEDIYWSDVYRANEARGAVSSAVRTLLGLPQIRP